MGIIKNIALENHNRDEMLRFLAFANERNCELFFAVGVDVTHKAPHIFYNTQGGIDRVIDTMEITLRDLKKLKAEGKVR